MKLRTKNGSKPGSLRERKQKCPNVGQIAPSRPKGAKQFHAQATEPVAIAKAPTKPLGIPQTLKHISGMADVRYKFDKAKSAQAIALLLRRAACANKNLTKGQIVKMLYAADRRQIRRTGTPITGDQPFSLPHGPILGTILDLLNGKIKDDSWHKHFTVAHANTHLIHLLKDLNEDLLTRNERQSLEKAYDIMSKMTWKELQHFCHKEFGEWEDPGDGQKPIRFEAIFREVKKPLAFAQDLQELQKDDTFLLHLLA